MVIRFTSPASLDAALMFAGGFGMMRKAVVLMHERGESVAIEDDEGMLALAFLVPDGHGRREFCLKISSRAGARMRELTRAAQLSLGRLAEDGPIICHIVPDNRTGARMARIVGFSPDPEHPYRWILEAP